MMPRRNRLMKEKLLALKEEALRELSAVQDQQQLNDLRIKYLGKKGPLTEILRGMGSISAEERPVIGQVANDVRGAIESLIDAKQEQFAAEETERKLRAEMIDVTLPGRSPATGAIHPLNKVIQEIEDVFIGMGYKVAEGPDVEKDYYNFEALNLPKNHP